MCSNTTTAASTHTSATQTILILVIFLSSTVVPENNEKDGLMFPDGGFPLFLEFRENVAGTLKTWR
jgi:hypothetical protein